MLRERLARTSGGAKSYSAIYIHVHSAHMPTNAIKGITVTLRHIFENLIFTTE